MYKIILFLAVFCTSIFSITSDDGRISIVKTISSDTTYIGDTLEVTLNLTTKTEPDTIDLSNRDVILLFDVSGSMNGERIKAASDAGVAFVRSMKPGKRVSVWEFGHLSYPSVEQMVPFTSDTSILINYLDTLIAQGSTPLFEATYLASKFAKDNSVNTPPVLIILGDGPAIPTDVDAYEQIALDSLKHYNTIFGLEAYTIALGTEVNYNVSQLKNIAKVGSGKFYQSPTPAELEAVFVDIAQNIVEVALSSRKFYDRSLPLIDDILPGYVSVVDDSVWVTKNSNIENWSYVVDQVRSSKTGESLTRLRFDLPYLKYGDILEVKYRVVFNKAGDLKVDISQSEDSISYCAVNYIFQDSISVNLPFSSAQNVHVISKIQGISLAVAENAYKDNSVDALILANVGDETILNGYVNESDIVLQGPPEMLIEYNGFSYTGSLTIKKGEMSSGSLPIKLTYPRLGETVVSLTNSERITLTKIDYDTIHWKIREGYFPLILQGNSWIDSIAGLDTLSTIKVLKSLAIKSSDTLRWKMLDSLNLYSVGIDTLKNRYKIVKSSWSITGLHDNSSFWYPVAVEQNERLSSAIGINDIKGLGTVEVSSISSEGIVSVYAEVVDGLDNFFITFPETVDTVYSSSPEVDTIYSSFYTESKKYFYAHSMVNGVDTRVKLYWDITTFNNEEVMKDVVADETSIFFKKAENMSYSIHRNGIEKQFVLKLESKLGGGIYPNPLHSSVAKSLGSSIFIVDIGQVGYIKATITDIEGNLVKEFKGFQGHGLGGDFKVSSADLKNKLAVRYSVNFWDGKNEKGLDISTGVYLLRFTMNIKNELGEIETKSYIKSFYYIK